MVLGIWEGGMDDNVIDIPNEVKRFYSDYG